MRHIYSISQLNSEVRAILEGSFPLIWIEGEISNLSQPSSGHVYFSLKDSHAQVRCALFNARSRRLNFKLQNGMHVLVNAKVSLYEGRGDFQLIVETMEDAGTGALQRAFEALKQKLSEEGLFDLANKKIIPRLPQCIGVITSSTGAAIRDILSVLKRRAPSIPIIIYPTLVQGKEAAPQIVRTLQLANTRHECDVILLARGGGSLEDLFAFNEEPVARAIFASEIPIVTGIGHEVDFTIADFVADQRAPTPSAAAELVSPNSVEWQLALTKFWKRLKQAMMNQLKQHQQHLFWFTKRLRHPGMRLQEFAQRCDMLELSLKHAMINALHHQRASMENYSVKLEQQNPSHRIELFLTSIDNHQKKLAGSVNYFLQQSQEKLSHLSGMLDSVSPLSTLQRGYSIMTRARDGKLVTEAKHVLVGEKTRVRLAQGELVCEVLSSELSPGSGSSK